MSSASDPSDPSERDQPEIDRAVREIFGERASLAARYAGLLCGEGITRGVVGPREADRIWSRHILNSAVLAALIRRGARVVDLGSGAGLPGIPLAIARPDLDVLLLEPMHRRVDFLRDALEALDLGPAVRVHQGRAQDGLEPPVDYVVARAIAPLDVLMRLSFGLLSTGGELLALKGATGAGELEQVKSQMAVDAVLITLPAPGQAATVIRVLRPDRWRRAIAASPAGRRRR